MFYIVETEDKLSRIRESDKSVFVDIIPSSDNYHPKLTTPLAFYIRPLNSNQGYIAAIDHPDCIGFSLSTLKEFLNSFEKVLVLDKKKFLHHFFLTNLIDLQFIRVTNGYQKFDQFPNNKTIDWFYTKFFNDPFINKTVPISLHYQLRELLFLRLQDTFSLSYPSDENLTFFNDTSTKVFYLLEQNGLQVKNNAFTDLYKLENPNFNCKDGEYFGYFNLYNHTTRPTNSFNGINFLAIPHKNEYREKIVPKNDKFIEFDFDGYHLRLLCDLAGIALTKESAHKQFAKYYFGKEEISDEEYKEAKQINFQIVYGKIPDKYMQYDLFKRIKEFTDSLWSRYTKEGLVVVPISHNKIRYKEDINPNKLLNYYIQGYETARNTVVLKDLLKLLSSKRSFISLYTYDSILIDFKEEEGEGLLKEVKEIMEADNKFPVHYKASSNLVF